MEIVEGNGREGELVGVREPRRAEGGEGRRAGEREGRGVGSETAGKRRERSRIEREGR